MSKQSISKASHISWLGATVFNAYFISPYFNTLKEFRRYLFSICTKRQDEERDRL